jgi:hypothetical protein
LLFRKRDDRHQSDELVALQFTGSGDNRCKRSIGVWVDGTGVILMRGFAGLLVAILVIAAVPVCAQAQSPSAAKLTRADVRRAVKIISGDKAKTGTYCQIGKLGEQIEAANDKKDSKTVDELSQRMKELEKNLGPEYVALMDKLQDVDPESEDGQEIGSVLQALDKLCTK